MTFTLNEVGELAKLEFLENYRYDVEAINFEGEKEDWVSLVSEIVESSSGISLNVLVPAKMGNLVLSKVNETCNFLKTINVIHHDNQGNVAFETSYGIEEFLGWEIVTKAEGKDLLTIKLSFDAIPKIPVTQSEEGLNEWLKEQGENK